MLVIDCVVCRTVRQFLTLDLVLIHFGCGAVFEFLHGINWGRNNEMSTAYAPLQIYRPASDAKRPEECKS